jgi:hypothetical protein
MELTMSQVVTPPCDALAQIGSGWVEAPDSDDSTLLDRHWEEADMVFQAGRAGRERIAPFLLGRIADREVHSILVRRLTKSSFQPPGPNGFRFDMIRPPDRDAFCAALGEAIRRGNYCPGPERVIPISRGAGGASSISRSRTSPTGSSETPPPR